MQDFVHRALGHNPPAVGAWGERNRDWTTSPTPDYAAALPEGAGWAQDGVQHWHSDRSNGREYHFVAYSLDGKPGLAVVDVAASPPRRVWSLADAGIEPLEGRPAVIGDPSFGIAVAIAGEDGAELVVLEPADDSVRIAHHFFVPDPACHQASPRLAQIDLSGDGLPERIILTADPLRAWFYPAAGRLASERAIRPVASLEGTLQLLDGDGDCARLVPWAGRAMWPAERSRRTLAGSRRHRPAASQATAGTTRSVS